ncbi:hypothetical protein EVAR_51309_1 [Eumeta japonica]|uniref:Uncharacterized protein n=1 Tax=Eumeta variegata TaxID=151549 RepID=A0A4C1XSK0_EUMVA|nr:hypothetical protein EVAR_51309_1 [Eumeta japonica]
MCSVAWARLLLLLAACWAQEGEWSEDAEDLASVTTLFGGLVWNFQSLSLLDSEIKERWASRRTTVVDDLKKKGKKRNPAQQ